MAKDRRSFLMAAPLGLGLLPLSAQAADDRPNVIGPRTGYSPQVGTLVSMMTWMLNTLPPMVARLTQPQLDHLLDDRANSIGALLLHLAATETYYQLNTFDDLPWDGWSEEVKKKWNPAMNLGDAGRATIKGHDIEFYRKTMEQVRNRTLAEFRKRDDAWLMTVDEKWPWGPTNNYCKWFHVCEHISHHGGQIAMLLSRLPRAKPAA